MKRIERIVVGTDFSPVAERALDEALDLASQLGASVILVHAYEIPAFSFPDAVVTATSEMVQAIATASLAGLAASVERRKQRGIEIRTVLRVGAPSDELEAVAREEGADLIVVGTHGRGGISHVLLGSVAERLLRKATRPVVVIRGAEAS